MLYPRLKVGLALHFRFLKIALKIRIKTIPPMHIINRTSGVIYFNACIKFGGQNRYLA